MFRSGAKFFLLTTLVGLFLMRESSRDPVAQWDESFADFLAMNAQRQESAPQTTLVRIDKSSLTGHPWPWSPVDFALFFQSANGFAPEILATDEILNWRLPGANNEVGPKLTQYEQLLREHVLKSPRVLLGSSLGFPEDPSKLPELEPAPVLRKFLGDIQRVPEFTIIDAQASEDFRLSSTSGFINLPTNSNWHRSVPMVLRYRGQLVPSFVLQAVLMWEKASLDEVAVELGNRIQVGDRLSIPIDATGQMRVDFGAERSQCGMDDLVLSAEQRDGGGATHQPPTMFSGRFLLLARTDPDARNLLLARGQPGSRGELFAAAIATVQGRSFIQRAPWWVDAATIGFFALLSLWIPRWSRGLTLFIGFVLIPAYVLTALAVFGSTLTWVSGVLPAGLILFQVLYRLVSPNIDPWAVPPKPRKS